MNQVRVLIVDDEPLARQRIRTLLDPHEDLEVIGECSDGRQATLAIREQDPDLVFLDIEMPEVDGFGVVEAIVEERSPVIIFVTAFNEHAVRAFEINALDYLLKPFDVERFETALRRARHQLSSIQSGATGIEQRMLAALEQMKRREFVSRLMIKADDRMYFLEVSEIDWIEAAGKYVRLHTGSEKHLLREPLQHLESRLDPQTFVRIHRSTIVNLNSVRSMEPMFHGEYRVSMRDGTGLTLSRGYRSKLRERFDT